MCALPKSSKNTKKRRANCKLPVPSMGNLESSKARPYDLDLMTKPSDKNTNNNNNSNNENGDD